jgi:DNA-binding NarL/FixJ family response regulator
MSDRVRVLRRLAERTFVTSPAGGRPSLYARELLSAGTGGLGYLLKDRVSDVRRFIEGRTNAGIATRLVVTDKAVSKHINNIFTKLDLHPAEDDNRRVLAVLAYLNA